MTAKFLKNYIFACIWTKRVTKEGILEVFFRKFCQFIFCKTVLKEKYCDTITNSKTVKTIVLELLP